MAQARLTHQQFYALCEWVKKPGRFAKATPLTEAAREAEKELGYAISSQSVQDAIKATGVHYTPPTFAVAKHQKQSDVQTIAQELVFIMTKLGETPKPELMAIAKGKKEKK